MTKKAYKTPSGPNAGYVIGRRDFAKISAIERIVVSREMEAEFRSFDRARLTAPERRRILTARYGKDR